VINLKIKLNILLICEQKTQELKAILKKRKLEMNYLST